MPAVIGVLLGIAAYLALCGVVVWFVVLPVAGTLTVVGLVVGTVLAVGSTADTLLAGRAELRGPGDVNDVVLFPPSDSGHGRDPAWPHYLARQGRDDLAEAARAVLRRTGRVWATVAEGALERPGVLLAWPLGLLVLIPAAAATAGALATVVVVTVVGGVVLGAAVLVWGGAGLLLRRVDALLLRRKRARAECPVCFYSTTLPSYPCACGAVHHDVRPSRLGVLWHRCRCGTPMPTTVSRAGRKRAPQCPKCAQPLQLGAGVWTTVSVPVIGPVSAGKTSFLYASLAALGSFVVRSGGTFEASGEASRELLEHGLDQVRAGRVTKTDPTKPVGVVVRVSDGTQDALLHTYDAAGELFDTREQNSGMRFIDHAEQMVLVIDPFSMPEIADEAAAHAAATLADANPATEPPERAYESTVPRIRDQGEDLARITLAVVVVKADLLIELPVARGLRTDSDSVRRWLRDHGEDHLVTRIERDFPRVRYFLVSSRTGVEDTDWHTAAAPLRWLAESAQLPLPAAVLPARPGRTSP